jgi:hypothetical protein
MSPNDESFIFASWLNAYRSHSQFARNITDTTFFDRHHKVIERILKDAKALVCVDSTHPDTILGYLVYQWFGERPLIHFIYVKMAFRKMGLANQMLSKAGIDLNEGGIYTHRTDKRYLRKHQDALSPSHTVSEFDWIDLKYPKLVYDPYLI